MKALKIGPQLLFILALGSVALAWQGNPVASKLSALKSADWQERCAAYEEIKSNEETLKRLEVKAALVDLLDRENQIMRKYGKEYSECTPYLQDTVAEIADWHDARQVCVLAESAYEGDSQFASELAIKGGAIAVPCLLKMARGNVEDRYKTMRYEAIPVLAHILAASGDLSPGVRKDIRQVVLSGLLDPQVGTREVTIEALGSFGTSEWVPLLEPIARNDPYSRHLDNGTLRFDVRERAAKAIQSIQERTKKP
jgi:hypothetical protein